MAQNGQHRQKLRWVVLLNKSPKGPLTEEDVKTLLNQGILRANDIAYQVDSSDPKAHTEWKLLWQFAEFNRRQPESFTGEQTTPRKTEPERRQPEPIEEIKKRALEDLPVDLLQITPEDLLPKTTSLSLSPEPEMGALAAMDSIEEKPDASNSSGLGFDMRWAYGAGGFLVLSFAILQMKSYFNSPRAKREISPQETAERSAPETMTRRIAPSGGTAPNRALATPSARPYEAPVAREREEYQAPPPPPDRGRMDRPDEAEDDRYERAAENEDAPVNPRRSKKRRRPARTNEDDEAGYEGEGGNGGDSYQDNNPAPQNEEAEPQSEYDE